MQLISEWIINIVIFILLAMIVDMLLPDTAMKKYVKFVVGLLLISIVVTPIFKFLSTDFDQALHSFLNDQSSQNPAMEKSLEEKKREIETSQHAYILEQMAVQLKEKVEKEMIASHGMTITNIDISSTSSPAQDLESILKSINKITVYVEPMRKKDSVAEVEQVSIQIKDQPRHNQSGRTKTLRNMLASEWDVPDSKIELVVKGGTDDP